MNIPKLDAVINTMVNNGYSVFDTPEMEWNLNIVGIRSAGNSSKNFDDLLLVFFRQGNDWGCYFYNITTDPSPYYLEKPLSDVYTKGTAILKEGQYKEAYEINFHHGKYEALCQNLGPVVVYRDNNYDEYMNLIPGTEEVGYFKINIHKGPVDGESTTLNKKYSAGCQVFLNIDDFNEFMSLCFKSREIFGNKFTYTLINENDLNLG
ncbi:MULTISPECIES: hypothetical protein [Lelliottia]|uniref:Uncharacterized protein n=1 Tax=Lelliottia wanjuensis TaxID=3050585 RepID=A0AAP4CZX8_9ENTR|nr:MULTISPECIES: hypothetical protein [unclassified Lelliottia]MDK9362442.1 hypothetical protein [Lelliottia sp. V106_12]MDK9585289.1 hypothetical protein [Lelliottia sp. V86_10]MDK9616235.1 hypothetical protein [Lelliottia sp. V106_9]